MGANHNTPVLCNSHLKKTIELRIKKTRVFPRVYILYILGYFPVTLYGNTNITLRLAMDAP